MVWGLIDAVVDTAVKTTTTVAKTGLELATDPVKVVSDVMDTGTKLATGFTRGATIAVDGVRVQIEDEGIANVVYDALVPQTAQAVLDGRMPTRNDFESDAVAYINGPIQGIYVAANSESARKIKAGEVLDADQLGEDMCAALTPIAKRKLGLL